MNGEGPGKSLRSGALRRPDAVDGVARLAGDRHDDAAGVVAADEHDLRLDRPDGLPERPGDRLGARRPLDLCDPERGRREDPLNAVAQAVGDGGRVEVLVGIEPPLS